MSPGVTPTVAAAVFADAQRTWLVTSFVVPSFSRAFAVSFKLTPGRRTTAGDGTMSIDSMRGSATVIVAVPTASFARSVTRMTTEPGSEPAVMSPVLDTVAMLRFDEEYITRSVTCSTGPPGKRRVTESCIVFPLTSVVAEGAETDSDAIELYQLGCEYAQGFAFGEPMDADAATGLLTEERLEAAY